MTDYYLKNGDVNKENFDTEQDYGNECARVFFRITTNGFDSANGFFPKQGDREAFYTEMEDIFKTYGLTQGVTRFNEPGVMHIHPNIISGILYKNDIKKIGDALEDGKTFRMDWVDIYETIYDMSDEEYEEYLSGKDEEIRRYIFENAHTTRTYYYYDAADISRRMANKYALQRIGKESDMRNRTTQTSKHIFKIIQNMVNEGLLMTYTKDQMPESLMDYLEEKSILYFRSPNKTEQKKKKIKFAQEG